MEFFTAVFSFLATAAGLLLSFFSAWWLMLALAGLFHRKPVSSQPAQSGETVILLPAYAPGSLFAEVLARINTAIAGRINVRVLILLQNASESAASVAKSSGFETIQGDFSASSGNPYHHALRFAVSYIREWSKREKFVPARLLLLDKDNLLEAGALEKLEAALSPNLAYAQGRRVPLNLDSNGAKLDHLSEELNDLLFRRGLSVLGGAPELSGSGVLFQFETFETAVFAMDSSCPGMDKALMSELLQRGANGVFVPDALVFEEKTSELDSLQKQRVRWLGAQYYIGWNHAARLFRAAFVTRSLAPVFWTITLLRPPRSAHALLAAILGAVEFGFMLLKNQPLAGNFPWFFASAWMIVLALVPLLFSTGTAFFDSLASLPRFALNNLRAAFAGIRPEQRGRFIHTRHNLG